MQSPCTWSTVSTPLEMAIPLQPMFHDEAVEPNNPQENDWDNFEEMKGDLNANMDYKAK